MKWIMLLKKSKINQGADFGNQVSETGYFDKSWKGVYFFQVGKGCSWRTSHSFDEPRLYNGGVRSSNNIFWYPQ